MLPRSGGFLRPSGFPATHTSAARERETVTTRDTGENDNLGGRASRFRNAVKAMLHRTG
jgi:hypothetical protein